MLLKHMGENIKGEGCCFRKKIWSCCNEIKQNFGFIPNEFLPSRQYLIANQCNWTVTKHEDKPDEDNGESKHGYC